MFDKFDKFERMALLNAPPAMVLTTFTATPLMPDRAADTLEEPSQSSYIHQAVPAPATPTTRSRLASLRLRFGLSA